MNSQPGWPRLIGHRGAAKWAPENTLASFFCAHEAGASWVELDVRLSRDGVPVVFHDSTLDRTSNGQGQVVEHDLASLKGLDAGAWFSPRFRGETIPTLAEALSCIASLSMGVTIEIKPDADNALEVAQATLNTARQTWPESSPSPLISSFSKAVLVEARRLCSWPIGFLAERFDTTLLASCQDLRAATLNLNARNVQPLQIVAIHQAGLALLVYTVNEPTEARRLWAMGVDGIFTDDPKLLSEG